MMDFDILILGTGPAATQVALQCSRRGRRVAIVDPRPFGGTCALRGCIPKKVLVRAAELFDWIGRVEGTGVRTEGAAIDWAELIAFKRSFTEPVTRWKEGKFRDAGVEQFHGTPRFVAPQRVTIDGNEVESRQFVIATGAVPRPLGIPGEQLVVSSDDFLELERLPKRVLFIGGGYVTFEFAHVAARAGAKVTVVEAGPRPLARFDPDLVDGLLERTREIGIEILTSMKVESIEKRGGGLRATIASDSKTESNEFDLVVHGAGRVPNVSGLDLDAGNVRFSSKGVEVDDYLQSVSNPAVYAAGDVAATGAPPLSPVARKEGEVLVHNLLEHHKKIPEYGPVATVVFSVPALASVGLGEDEARQKGLRFSTRTGDRSGKNSMKMVRARHARYKVLVENSTERILGAHLLGPDAAATINLYTLAIKHGITETELKSTLFAFPTFGNDVRGM